jgi:hypothetical protein
MNISEVTTRVTPTPSPIPEGVGPLGGESSLAVCVGDLPSHRHDGLVPVEGEHGLLRENMAYTRPLAVLMAEGDG